MAVKLHRCSLTWLKVPGHACHRVQKALDQAGIAYEVVKVPLSRGKRDEVKRLTGQAVVPVIEFEDGNAYREESKDMAAKIQEGRLFEGAPPSPAAGQTAG
jgi:glutathione S-transferase